MGALTFAFGFLSCRSSLSQTISHVVLDGMKTWQNNLSNSASSPPKPPPSSSSEDAAAAAVVAAPAGDDSPADTPHRQHHEQPWEVLVTPVVTPTAATASTGSASSSATASKHVACSATPGSTGPLQAHRLSDISATACSDNSTGDTHQVSAGATGATGATARSARAALAELKIKQHALHGSRTSGTAVARSKAAERKMTGLTTEDEEALIGQLKGWKQGLNPETDIAKVNEGGSVVRGG